MISYKISSALCRESECRLSIDFINGGIKSLSIPNNRENKNIILNIIPTSGVEQWRGFLVFCFSPYRNYQCSPTVSSLTMPCTFPVQFTSNFCLLRSVQWEVKLSRFFADKTKVVTFVVLLAYLHFKKKNKIFLWKGYTQFSELSDISTCLPCGNFISLYDFYFACNHVVWRIVQL